VDVFVCKYCLRIVWLIQKNLYRMSGKKSYLPITPLRAYTARSILPGCSDPLFSRSIYTRVQPRIRVWLYRVVQKKYCWRTIDSFVVNSNLCDSPRTVVSVVPLVAVWQCYSCIFIYFVWCNPSRKKIKETWPTLSDPFFGWPSREQRWPT